MKWLLKWTLRVDFAGNRGRRVLRKGCGKLSEHAKRLFEATISRLERLKPIFRVAKTKILFSAMK